MTGAGVYEVLLEKRRRRARLGNVWAPLTVPVEGRRGIDGEGG